MSQSILNRTYTPPPPGSFDPLTAAITGGLPAFYTYGPRPAPALSLSDLTSLASGDLGGSGDGGGGGDGGGLGSGGVNMGGEMIGGIDLGPNPGTLGSGTLGNLGNIDLSNISLTGGLRGAGLGGMLAGPVGALAGLAVGALAPALSDANNARETARAQQEIHDRAVEAMLADLRAQEQTVAADLEGRGLGGGFTGMSMDEAVANAVAANIDADYGPGGVQGGLDAAQAQANADAANIDADSQPGGVNDGGGGGGDSKIVCTAMNAAYGFGSYRNKIWLAYAAKNLSKAHEVGYHTLFMPLVKAAYHESHWYSNPLRKALEHIARHRSADLRAEMRNSKRDTTGRIYRAVLEPVCYLVGKMKGH